MQRVDRIDDAVSLPELTLRGIILGALITVVFTASNVYLGLKVGLTFASSIPAAVISMAVLRSFANHSIVENNIVQTVASAAGTLSSIIFVLPGLVMMGHWQGFPFLHQGFEDFTAFFLGFGIGTQTRQPDLLGGLLDGGGELVVGHRTCQCFQFFGHDNLLARDIDDGNDNNLDIFVVALLGFHPQSMEKK